MGKSKAQNRGHHQPQPPPQPSDYETDVPATVDVPKPPPRSNEQLNLSVLMRHYPGVVGIRHVTAYSVLYTFNLDSQQWEKVGIEGTLFVCQLIPDHNGADRFSVIILNRRGLMNFDLEILSEEEMEFEGEYIIVQGDQVYGIWVFQEPNSNSTANARVEAAEAIKSVAREAEESRKAIEKIRGNGVGSTAQGDGGVPMGRQLSLRELFGQQREQDAAWSVHNHHSAQQIQPQFLVGQPMQQPPQQDVLGLLFSKAKQDYNGVG
jgi:hypothetical protein